MALPLRIAVAHVQFEAIHPFSDGNGRVGRLLPPLMMAAEGLPPLYLAGYLKANQRTYYDLLADVQVQGRWTPWLAFFLEGIAAAAATEQATAQAVLRIRHHGAPGAGHHPRDDRPSLGPELPGARSSRRAGAQARNPVTVAPAGSSVMSGMRAEASPRPDARRPAAVLTESPLGGSSKRIPTAYTAANPGSFPDYAAPIVRNTPAGREMAMARSGMPAPVFALKGRSSDPGVTNVRNTASPHWRRWLGVESRCLVPFTSFSENEALPDGRKPPIWFALSEERPLACFAGIWTTWTSVRKVSHPSAVALRLL